MNKINNPTHPYVTKAIYINSFSLPSNLWFVPEAKIKNKVYNQIRAIYKQQAKISGIKADGELISEEKDNDYETDVDLDQIIEFDPNILDGPLDSKLLEGQWIYNNFINYFQQNPQYKNYKIIDYSKEFATTPIQQKAEYIYKYYLSQDKIIIFKPLFLSRNMAKAVPHAIIKNGDNITICEAFASKNIKGTQTLSLIYDYHIINDCLVKHHFPKISDYNIYLIEATKKAKKNTLPLIQCYYLCWIKSSKKLDKLDNSTKFLLSDFWQKKENKLISGFKNYFDQTQFWQQIEKIYQTPVCETIDLNPSIYFTQGMKTDQIYMAQLKQLWCCSNKWHFIGYSGKILQMKHALSLEKAYNENFAKKTPLNLNNVIDHLKFLQLNPNLSVVTENVSENGRKNILNFKTRKWTYIFNAIKQASNKKTYFIPSECKNHFKKLKNKKIYFDFESICLARRPMDNVDAFQQICTQVSIIRDFGDIKDPKQMLKANLVFDPGSKSGLTSINMEQIIDALLEKVNINNINQYSFVVYNKDFEVNRLEEMKEIINKKDYNKKIDLIIDNIYDLADCFNIEKCLGCFIWQLKGFFSIKYVLNFIMNEDYELYKYVGCLNYKEDLNIHNGVDAQNITTLRFYGKINDDQWKKVEIDLKKYCENDVRSMIALEYWLRSKCNE